MPDTGKTTNKKRKVQKDKGNEDHLLTKPKRAMSAYNFFFRDERARILSEALSHGARPSFEQIGKTIGERWRNLQQGGDDQQGDLTKYKKLADEDAERYDEAMEAFDYGLTILRLGQTSTPDAWGLEGHPVDNPPSDVGNGNISFPPRKFPEYNDDGLMSNARNAGLVNQPSRAPAASTSARQSNGSTEQQHQATVNTDLMKHQLLLMNNITLCNTRIQSSSLEPSSCTSTKQSQEVSVALDEQIFQLLLQHHRSNNQQSSSQSRTPSNESIMKLILTQKQSIQRRTKTLTAELTKLQLRSRLLDEMLTGEATRFLQGTGNGSGLRGIATSSFPFAGSRNTVNAGISMEELTVLQLVQAQQQAVAARNATGSIIGSHDPVNGRPLSVDGLAQLLQSQPPAALNAIGAAFAGHLLNPPAPVQATSPTIQAPQYKNNKKELSYGSGSDGLRTSDNPLTASSSMSNSKPNHLPAGDLSLANMSMGQLMQVLQQAHPTIGLSAAGNILPLGRSSSFAGLPAVVQASSATNQGSLCRDDKNTTKTSSCSISSEPRTNDNPENKSTARRPQANSLPLEDSSLDNLSMGQLMHLLRQTRQAAINGVTGAAIGNSQVPSATTNGLRAGNGGLFSGHHATSPDTKR